MMEVSANTSLPLGSAMIPNYGGEHTAFSGFSHKKGASLRKPAAGAVLGENVLFTWSRKLLYTKGPEACMPYVGAGEPKC